MGSSDGEGKGGGRKRSRSAEGGDDERKGKGKERRDDDRCVLRPVQAGGTGVDSIDGDC